MPHAPAATLVRGTWHPGSILCRDNLHADGFVAHSSDWDGGYPASSCCSKGTTKTLAKYGFLTMSAQCHTSHWCLKKEKARVFLLVFHEKPLQMKLLSTAWASWHLGWPRGSQINKVFYEKKNKKTEVKKKIMVAFLVFLIPKQFYIAAEIKRFIPVAQFTVGLWLLVTKEVIWKT